MDGRTEDSRVFKTDRRVSEKDILEQFFSFQSLPVKTERTASPTRHARLANFSGHNIRQRCHGASHYEKEERRPTSTKKIEGVSPHVQFGECGMTNAFLRLALREFHPKVDCPGRQ